MKNYDNHILAFDKEQSPLVFINCCGYGGLFYFPKLGKHPWQGRGKCGQFWFGLWGYTFGTAILRSI